MKNRYYLHCCIFLIFSTTLYFCTPVPDKKFRPWTYKIEDHGTNSTPRFRDLNGDGILDIIIGAGKNEHERASHGVFALNGLNGSLLWKYEVNDQIVGSPVFNDINQDGVEDVIIGGRSAQLMALDGTDGTLIWQYAIDTINQKTSKARYNFYNSQVLRDLDGDSVADVLVANGGNVWAFAKSEIGREAGVLMILSGANGTIIALDTMPDGKETYFSPVFVEDSSYMASTIIFGSGGETISGHLYRTTLSELLANDISESKILLSEDGHGFIGPVTMTDLNRDGTPDVVGNTHGGKIFAIDGRSDQILWEKRLPNVESSTMVMPGHFTDLNKQDVFCFLSIGIFPHNRGTIQLLLDGNDGHILDIDTMGCFSFASPILIQADNDPYHEVMYSVNEYSNCDILFKGNVTSMVIKDFGETPDHWKVTSYPGKNLSVTPSLADIDGDGSLELVQVVLKNYSTTYLMYGMQVIASRAGLKVNDTGWNTYMGDRYDCVLNE